jgi:hypothetical protein
VKQVRPVPGGREECKTETIITEMIEKEKFEIRICR